MDVEVVTPIDYLGDLMGDLSSRRGRVGGMTGRGDAQVIGASVPLGEMFGYSTTLRSLSQGRAVYTMQFSHYDEVPKAKPTKSSPPGATKAHGIFKRRDWRQPKPYEEERWARQNLSGRSRT